MAANGPVTERQLSDRFARKAELQQATQSLTFTATQSHLKADICPGNRKWRNLAREQTVRLVAVTANRQLVIEPSYQYRSSFHRFD